jgi:Flp pilus assembly protein TadD
LQKADFDSAIAQFQAALKIAPQDPTSHYDLGLALKLKDRLPDAIVEFKKAAELAPDQPDIHYTLGVTLWQKGDFGAAEDELRAATQAKPDYAEAFYTLGTVLKQDGKLQDAATALRKAISLQPDLVGAHTNLAGILRQLGDTSGADEESRRAQEIFKKSNGLQAATFNTNSGKRLLQAGDLDGAISQFRSAITMAPDYAPAHLQLAQALHRKGEKVEAEQESHKAAALDAAARQQ